MAGWIAGYGREQQWIEKRSNIEYACMDLPVGVSEPVNDSVILINVC
jgi:hypothetical protein